MGLTISWGGGGGGGGGHVDTLKCSYTYSSAQCRQTMALCTNELDMMSHVNRCVSLCDGVGPPRYSQE